MQGKIRWLSEDRSDGFIVDDAALDHHFLVQDIIDATVPKIGSVVEFDAAPGPGGLRAKAVRVLSEPNTSPENRGYDDHVKCAGCGQEMIPQISTDSSGFEKSACPFCGAPHKPSVSMSLWVWILIIGVVAYEIIATIRFYLHKS